MITRIDKKRPLVRKRIGRTRIALPTTLLVRATVVLNILVLIKGCKFSYYRRVQFTDSNLSLIKIESGSLKEEIGRAHV